MKKSSALALAIAGTMVAPVAMAESGFYMSARLGVESISHDDDTQEGLVLGNLNSRLGWASETDLGNGMTAYGKLEASASFGIRHLYVGLKGDFGDFKIADQTYAAYYNHVSAPVDQPYYVGGVGILDGNSRSTDFISYSGGAGAVSFEVSLEGDGVDTSDSSGRTTSFSGTQAGLSFGAGDWTIGIGMRDSEDSAQRPTNGTITGVTVSGNLGDIYIAVSAASDDDDTGIQSHFGFGPFFLNYGQYDDDSADNTPSEIGVGYARSIGRNTTFWAEAASLDSDGGDDSTEIYAALRYDWK